MEVRTLAELENIKRAATNGHEPNMDSDELNGLNLDEPTDTETEQKTTKSKKKYFVIGVLMTCLLTASYFFMSGFSETTKKNTIVAKNKDSNVSMPGFSPDSASQVLINEVNTNTSPTPATNTQINSNINSGNTSPEMQSRIQPPPPIEKNPIFGKIPPNQNNTMNVPVTEQVETNTNTNPANPQGSQVKQNVAITSTPNPLFNTSPNYEVKGNSGTNRASNDSVQISAQSNTSNEPIKSIPSQQKSYFLFAKDSRNETVKETNPEAVLPNVESLSKKTISPLIEIEKRPPFGTMLPLQTLGAIDTLGNTPLIRMILTRTMKGEGWELERGTIFIGRATGGRGNRAYIQVVGYLDTGKNALVRIGGDLQGVDGASGLLGEKKKIGSRWLNVIREIGNKASQTANTWIGSRNGSGTNITLPSQNEMGIPAGSGNNIEYVFVRPNSFGYFLVNDLPKEVNSESAPLPQNNSDNPIDETQAGKYLTEAEVINLVSRGKVDEIRKAMPRIRPEYRKAIEDVLRTKGIN